MAQKIEKNVRGGVLSLHIKDIKVTDIKEYENNPRYNDGAVDAVAESIRQFGWKVPIVIDRNNVIIAGHTRLKAAKRLLLPCVPCVIADDLTPEEAKAFRLADNKTSELSEWNFEALEKELAELSATNFDMSDLGFSISEQDEYEKKKREFQDKIDNGELSEDSDEYQEFLQKFEAKKTTDDCYTPPNIYDAVADYVSEHYKVKKINFVRPFYPGGDYQKERYNPSAVVVDNPPFSILSEICTWYISKNIKFFLFAPGTTIMGVRNTQKVITGNTIVYENGAGVGTSFVTNMDEYEIRSAPDLYENIEKANKENLKKLHKELPKYEYPLECVRQTDFQKLSKRGQFFGVRKDECCMIRVLDSQKEYNKAIFGAAYLISERAAAERAAAERAAAERAAAEREEIKTVWKLSERERQIIKLLK